MIVGVFGSREGVLESTVNEYLIPRYKETVVLASGGAPGVDTFAENCWLTLGGMVWSYRPVKVSEDDWGIETWRLGVETPMVCQDSCHPTFADFKSAATYRDMLIAEVGDRGVAFWNGRSRGTRKTIDFFKAAGKPCAVHQ